VGGAASYSRCASGSTAGPKCAAVEAAQQSVMCVLKCFCVWGFSPVQAAQQSAQYISTETKTSVYLITCDRHIHRVCVLACMHSEPHARGGGVVLTRAVCSRLSCFPCEVCAWHDTDSSMPKSFGWGTPARHNHSKITVVWWSLRDAISHNLCSTVLQPAVNCAAAAARVALP